MIYFRKFFYNNDSFLIQDYLVTDRLYATDFNKDYSYDQQADFKQKLNSIVELFKQNDHDQKLARCLVLVELLVKLLHLADV